MEADSKKWEGIPCSLIERIIIVTNKMTFLHKAIYRFNVLQTKLPMTFVIKQEQIILKCVWNHKRPRIAKAILEKTKQEPSQTSGITIKPQESKQCGIGTETNMGQWNRIETPEINRTPGVSQSLARGGKTMQWENAVSSASSIGKAGQPHVNQ